MKLKEIRRTSTFAWLPSPSLPLLATGTVAGALDESFSNNGQLEIWEPDFLDKNEYELGGEGQPGAKAHVTTSSRFNRLAWGYTDGGRDRGVIVAGMENGELDIWDPSKILAQADVSESLVLRNKAHTGPVRGLDFNPIQTNLVGSGAVNGEIYIWDLKDPSKPYSPGTRSTKLDEITSLAWNHHVQYALAVSSSTGYTVVWDLRGKREVAALAYGGGAGAQAGVQGFGAGLAVGGRRGMSDVAWHPDNATRLVMSSEDDTSPVIMVWDLRNARAPEKILTGHEKGDNRALCWNPQTSEIIGELPSADNWAFQVDWCPRNPDFFATAFFDGTIGIHSTQSTNEHTEPSAPIATDATDIFDSAGFSRANQATLSLKQPPKWLRRPTSASFGYSGKLVSVSNLPGASGKHQSGVVHIRKVSTEPAVVQRVEKLQSAIESDGLDALAAEKSAQEPHEISAGRKALFSLFKANSRDELITLLGFSKQEIKARVAEAVEKLKASTASEAAPAEKDVTETDFGPREPVVSFAEPEREPTPEEADEAEESDLNALAAETTPSEVSTGAASDATHHADGESTTTAPSLFGDEIAGTPQTDAAADFFGSIGTSRSDEPHVDIPHHNYPVDSSVAAAIGSRPSSVASDTLKNNIFRIYPTDESETDRLVTKALVLGDFESAVSLCLSTGQTQVPELLQRTQKAYFERRTAELPYLRLFQSIVTDDLEDIVQNADLQEWQEIFVVLCTFASQDDFANLAEQLGQRLEFQASLAKTSTAPDAVERALEFRKNATLTYLAAGRLERLVNIWIEELAEEEAYSLEEKESLHGSRYTAHAFALQTFIEKVTVFRRAIKYEDTDLSQHASPEEEEARTYKLAALYDRYFEYADLLAAQGLVKGALSFLKLTPSGYHGSPGSHLDFTEGRRRLQIAAGSSAAPSSSTIANPSTVPIKAAPISSSTSVYGFGSSYGAPAQVQQTFVSQSLAPMQAPSTYGPYGGAPAYALPATQYGARPVAPGQSGHQPPAPSGYPSGPYGQPAVPNQQPAMPPPPRRSTPSAPLAPPPKGPVIKRDNGGWNDVPAHVTARRTPANANTNASKPSAIISPFPNAPSQGIMPPTPTHGQPPTALPPPPRPGSVQQRPPPPPQGQRMPPPPQQAPGPYPPHGAPSQGPPQGTAPPPSHMMSPSQGLGLSRGPSSQGQFTMPPPRGHVSHQTPPAAPTHLPPGPPPMRGTPSPALTRGTPPPQQPGVYTPPPPQQGGYAPPPPQGGFALPPQQGSFAPPPPGGAARLGMPPAGAPSMAPPPGSGQLAPSAPPKAKPGPPQPRYPPGDRSHIPDHLRPIFNIISQQLEIVKQTTPPQQKRLADDLERRINPLFDALNCEMLSKPVCDQLLELTRAMEARDRESALAIHIDLLRTGSMTDDIGLWMAGVKQLIMQLYDPRQAFETAL
ncbi:uncharacterized protein PHACADRAFT_214425 [Phanerochaete carnosa HHB-10118-sp]|uniref:Protein transport protein SEC31 n=2 Tax=Phanerochaete carnosa (strain HHB-10118-sp) TaxID=650164 RepID=K5VRS7_PHACS|nr:uncharacterized protein PHACADRAFT_214425 [Phanerochaete carnosa HHB-10118-sp]EKM49465.1 hypothetical protein PHACADRAFT_214425 [Phanerochaete carnosa HHB-10118-sp]